MFGRLIGLTQYLIFSKLSRYAKTKKELEKKKLRKTLKKAERKKRIKYKKKLKLKEKDLLKGGRALRKEGVSNNSRFLL